MLYALHVCAALIVGVLPGAWLGFTLPERHVPQRVKWALSFALAPCIVAVQIFALCWLGRPFSQAVWVIAGFNLLPLALIAQHWPWAHPHPTGGTVRAGLVPILLCFGFLMGILSAMWLAIPHFRTYSWHNMIQTAASYQIAHLPAIPEEADMAGLRLNYAWLGHVQITAVAWLLDCPPTIVFPWSNALMLLSLMVLLHASVCSLLPQRSDLSASAITSIILGNNFPNMVALMSHAPWFLQSDLRISPFFGKYPHFDAMLIGLALIAALVYIAVQATARFVPRLQLWVPVLVLATGISYPLLMPSAALIAGILWLVLWQNRFVDRPDYPRVHIWLMAAGVGLAIGSTLAYVRFLAADSSGVPWHPAPLHQLVRNLVNATNALALLILVGWPWLRDAWCRHPAWPLLLCSAAVALAGLCVVSSMPLDVQYKSLFAAVICLAPPAACQCVVWFSRCGGRSLLYALGTLILIATIAVPVLWLRHVPSNLNDAVPVDESHFYLQVTPHLSSGNPWYEAIRNTTPPNTVLITPGSAVPVSALVQRSSLIAGDLDYDNVRVGYSILVRDLLLDMKGYSDKAFAHRRALRQACYALSGTVDFAQLTVELQEFDRPLAIVFDRADTPYLIWLKARGLGEAIHDGSRAVVWFIPRVQL